jgi:hypothetical protein
MIDADVILVEPEQSSVTADQRTLGLEIADRRRASAGHRQEPSDAIQDSRPFK